MKNETKKCDLIVKEFICSFENKFVEVISEEAGGSLWKKKSNPDEVPNMVIEFASSLLTSHSEALRERVKSLRPQQYLGRQGYMEGYDNALDDILALLTDDKNI